MSFESIEISKEKKQTKTIDNTKLVGTLCRWFLQHARNLPWRKTQDPYAIWISEVMLQQTRVSAVIPYYFEFIKTFPHVFALAKAPRDLVLAKWAGLGYYSRAQLLHEGAKYLVSKCQGVFPTTEAEIAKIPGIGPYTTGAILSIAFNLPVPAVDGNVYRVLSRFFCWQEEISTKNSQRFFFSMTKNWIEKSASPRVFTQALMELGSLICTRTNPQCNDCPLMPGCSAFHSKTMENYPKKKKRQEKISLSWIFFVLEWEGTFFFIQNKEYRWWKGMWGFPFLDLTSQEEEDALTIIKNFQKQLDLNTPGFLLSTIKHTVTHHELSVVPYHFLVSLQEKETVEKFYRAQFPKAKARWLAWKEREEYAFSSLSKKMFSQLV